jgi:cell division septation protein DedD
MDWLRRNWVDVLMAGLILAVVGGFLTLLLRGGVFKPNTETNTPAATNSTSVTTVPAPTTPKPAPTQPAMNQPTSTPSSQPVAPTPKPVVTTPKPRTTTPLDVPEIPEAPVGTITTPVTKTSDVASSPNTTTSVTPKTPTNITTNRPVAKIQPNTATVTPTNTPLKTTATYARADFLRNYRVAAGSYISLERAKKAVAQLRSRGLPAQTFPSGKTHVVVVGPYAREASAKTAFTKVKQTFPDAILYRPDGTKEASARVSPAPAKPVIIPQGGGGGQPAALETAYLQVGAFKDIKGAAALLTKLKNAGFAPFTKNISGLLRVLVGPLQTNQIQTTRSELKNQGFEAFQVNL